MSLLVYLLLLAQETRPIPTVRGEIQTNESAPHFAVQLQSTSGVLSPQRTYVRADGSFELRDVLPGPYILKVIRFPEATVTEQHVNILGATDTLQIRLPEDETAVKNRAGIISVHALKHPLSKNALHAFTKAQHYSESGDHAKAIAELRRTLDDESAKGYARGNLGVEYLKSGQPATAIEELEEAVRLIPDSPIMHTNLAYALSVSGQLDRAEEEARRALQINRNHPQARYLLGHILLTRGASVEEGVENLKIARRDIPQARLVLAQYYARQGDRAAATKELREFLPDATGQDRAKAERWLSELEK